MEARDRYAGFWCRFLALIIDYQIVLWAMLPFFVLGGFFFPRSVVVDVPYGLFSTERVLEEHLDRVDYPDGSFVESEQRIVEETVFGRWIYIYKEVDVVGARPVEVSRTLIDPQTREPLDWITYDDFLLYVLILYWATMESSRFRASLGKRILGLEVTSEDGAQLSWLRALARNLGKLLSAIILLIGFMMVGWTNRKQGLHDKIARSLVVRR